MVMQQKTQRPVQFEITEQTRDSVEAWIKLAKLVPADFLFPSRIHGSPRTGQSDETGSIQLDATDFWYACSKSLAVVKPSNFSQGFPGAARNSVTGVCSILSPR